MARNMRPRIKPAFAAPRRMLRAALRIHPIERSAQPRLCRKLSRLEFATASWSRRHFRHGVRALREVRPCVVVRQARDWSRFRGRRGLLLNERFEPLVRIELVRSGNRLTVHEDRRGSGRIARSKPALLDTDWAAIGRSCQAGLEPT